MKIRSSNGRSGKGSGGSNLKDCNTRAMRRRFWVTTDILIWEVAAVPGSARMWAGKAAAAEVLVFAVAGIVADRVVSPKRDDEVGA